MQLFLVFAFFYVGVAITYCFHFMFLVISNLAHSSIDTQTRRIRRNFYHHVDQDTSSPRYYFQFLHSQFLSVEIVFFFLYQQIKMPVFVQSSQA